MRARWLKPEFFSDKKIAALGPVAALVYEALWCMADDGGTAPCDPDTVKAQMFYRWSAVGVPEITEALHALSRIGRIVRYQVGDDTYASIPTWNTHQKVHKPSSFRYPDASKGVAVEVPEECGTSEAPLPASPHPRHLDSQTPRELEGASAPAPVVRRVAKPKHPEWVGVGVAKWLPLVGAMKPDLFYRTLAPIVDIHGWDTVWADLLEWVSARKSAQKPCKLAWYAEEASSRITTVTPPLVDEWGCLTEYGERVTRPEAVRT